MIVRTSAKSRLIRPGIVIRSVMPCTPWRSTSSATLNASSIEVERSSTSSSRSFGMTIVVSHAARSACTPCVGLRAPLRSLELERRRHDPDRERAEIARDLRDDRRGAGAGAAALARRDEHHVRAAQRVLQLVVALLGRAAADVGIGAGAEALRQLAADVDLHRRVAHVQRLDVRVHRDELDLADAGVDHPVDGVHAGAADADDLDHGEVRARVARAARDAAAPAARAAARRSADGTAAAATGGTAADLRRRRLGRRRRRRPAPARAAAASGRASATAAAARASAASGSRRARASSQLGTCSTVRSSGSAAGAAPASAAATGAGSPVGLALRSLRRAEELRERALTHGGAPTRHRAPPSRGRGTCPRPLRSGRTSGPTCPSRAPPHSEPSCGSSY